MRAAAISLIVVLAVLAYILSAYSQGETETAPGGAVVYFDTDVMPLLDRLGKGNVLERNSRS